MVINRNRERTLEWLKKIRYRKVAKKDLKPDKEMIILDLELSYDFNHDPSVQGGATVIRLDEKPIVDGHVRYRCIEPPWQGQCSVPIDTMISPTSLSRFVYVVPC